MTRAELRRHIPGWYRWWLHAGLIASFSLGGIALCLWHLEAPRWTDWMLLFAVLVFANFGEWAVHVRTLHRRVFPYAPFERHIRHHAFFTHETMTVDSLDEIFWVMFPPWALPLMVAALLPFFALVAWVSSRNAAWIFLLAVFVYYGVYEIFHTLAHLPKGGGWLGAISEHHRVHHDPHLMKRWNFNFAIPAFDRLFGTLYRSRT